MNGGGKREGEKENDKKKGEDVYIVGIEFLIVLDINK